MRTRGGGQPTDRPELAALFTQLSRATIAAEQPVLREHDLSMWEYVVLGALRAGPAATQRDLADAIGYDKTRLIPLLDRLEQEGLVERTRDAADRRRQLVSLTAAGTERHTQAAAAIRRLEDDQLDRLTADERQAVETAIAALTSLQRALGDGR